MAPDPAATRLTRSGLDQPEVAGEPAMIGGMHRLRLVLRPFTHALLWLERIGIAVASVCFVAIVLVTALDVGMRYALNAPLIWSYQLIADYLMVAVFFLAIGATQRQGQNVGVDMIVRRLPERLRAALAAIALLLVLAFVGEMGLSGWDVFVDAWENGDVLAGVIAWPRWPALLLVPIGCLLLALRLFADVLANIGAACGALDLAPHRRARAMHGFSGE